MLIIMMMQCPNTYITHTIKDALLTSIPSLVLKNALIAWIAIDWHHSIHQSIYSSSRLHHTYNTINIPSSTMHLHLISNSLPLVSIHYNALNLFVNLLMLFQLSFCLLLLYSFLFFVPIITLLHNCTLTNYIYHIHLILLPCV